MTQLHTHPVDFNAIRADFPHTTERVWFGAGEYHPFNVHSLRVLENYSNYRTFGQNRDTHHFTNEKQAETKQLYADLINANPSEIAFIQSQTDGENIVIAGMALEQRGGNVVIDDLHFEASRYIYTQLAEKGVIELRVVPHHAWQVNPDLFEQYVDDETRLVSIALVTHINGFKADAARISEIAHAHGAYLYADIIQGVGNTHIDVKAMGIDFAATSTYKWLMGDHGIGFLYVDEALQGEIVAKTRYGIRQVQTSSDFTFSLKPGAAMYEGTGSMPNIQGLIVGEGLKYIASIGIDAIRGYVQPLIDRLQNELPPLGYQPITPFGTDTSIVSFIPDDAEKTKEKLDRAFGYQVTSFRTWYQTNDNGEREKVRGIRLGISFYNNGDEIDQFLEALS